jgi:glycolate oxidase FAD binding subunit
LRFGFGTPRDYVLGLRLAHINGTQSKCGGKVVKNVAGYDMNKLYVGSFGTLAVLTEITFKLRPIPERSATLMVTSYSAGSLVRTASDLLASELRPASLFLARGFRPLLAGESKGAGVLLVRFVESNEAVDYQISTVRRITTDSGQVIELADSEAATVWTRVANVDQQAANAFKLSVPISRAAESIEELMASVPQSTIAADLGTGIIRIALDADHQQSAELAVRWRREAASSGGTLTIEQAPLEVRRRVGAWNDAGPAAALMGSIKANFDPEGLLSPGRFVA